MGVSHFIVVCYFLRMNTRTMATIAITIATAARASSRVLACCTVVTLEIVVTLWTVTGCAVTVVCCTTVVIAETVVVAL